MAGAQESISVTLRGPTLEGYANEILKGQTAGLTLELAQYTKFEVLMQLHKVLQHPTGYYESQIRYVRDSLDSYRVDDNGVIYGPWLEGTGSRNSPVTAFPGYHTFRIVKNRMAQKNKAIIQAWAARAVKML